MYIGLATVYNISSTLFSNSRSVCLNLQDAPDRVSCMPATVLRVMPIMMRSSNLIVGSFDGWWLNETGKNKDK